MNQRDMSQQATKSESTQLTTNERVRIFQRQLKKTVQVKFLKQHNEYLLTIFDRKTQCYNNHPLLPPQYYNCIDKLQKMIEYNKHSLMRKVNQRREAMDSNIHKCANTQKNYLKFEECFQKQIQLFQTRIHKLYSRFYQNVSNEVPEKQSEKEQNV